ncbi:MAG: hypothetical protein ACOVSI_10710 [Gemmatimonas sp.]
MAAIFMLPDREDIGVITQFIVFAIALDLGGGVVANATRSTNDWYCSGPLWLRFIFLALHLIQPLLMALTVHLPWMTVGYLYLYQFCAGSVVIANRRSGFQIPLAAALLTLGLLLYITFFLPEPGVLWFGVLYLIKLVMMFSVDHHAGFPTATPNPFPNSQ